MLLNLRRWGPAEAESVVCIHGIAQHGGVFAVLGKGLAPGGRSVVAVDLRGHGESGHEPPWNVESHARDVVETLRAEGIRPLALVGHSFGARVAATIAAAEEDLVERLALLDPGLRLPPERALRRAEVDRLDWSFETTHGAVNALLGGKGLVAAPEEVVAAFVRDDLRQGVDGRYRFSFCPAAVVTAWSEMTLPVPPVAAVPTLVVWAAASLHDPDLERRYRDRLGEMLTVAKVPNGHNVLWESPLETTSAIERFLSEDSAGVDAIPGYFGDAGTFQPLL
ncbi:MAG TPA: alpha/beta fold hydrolase [Solirubrobacterales bacterium]|nr:alpha/beta fold hydrolase [Solirubrobacterales bacterium]